MQTITFFKNFTDKMSDNQEVVNNLIYRTQNNSELIVFGNQEVVNNLSYCTQIANDEDQECHERKKSQQTDHITELQTVDNDNVYAELEEERNDGYFAHMNISVIFQNSTSQDITDIVYERIDDTLAYSEIEENVPSQVMLFILTLLCLN